jgi:hypothetical protein
MRPLPWLPLALALGVAENPLGVQLRVERDEPGKGATAWCRSSSPSPSAS